MNFTKIFLSTALAVICCRAVAQHQMDNWVFGDSVGLNFSTGEPVFYDTNIRSYEASSCVSDSIGNLLFYTNGQDVWNKTNYLMPNGNSLNIGFFVPVYGGSTITQGVVIIPKPGDNDLFYIFYLTDGEYNYNLQYSIVDMTLNAGLGDVIFKNITVSPDSILREHMTAVKHGNGCDWWLVLVTGGNTEGDTLQFVKLLITPDGINGPYYQFYGDVFHDADSGIQAVGQMKFSPDGTKALICKGQDVDVFDFDRCTGEFSNYDNIDTVVHKGTSPTTYGLEFSPDGRLFYVGSWGPNPYLYQFCLSCPDPVAETKTEIYSGHLPQMELDQFLLGSDDKIYFATATEAIGPLILNQYLSVLNKPNLMGLACDLDTLSLSLGGHSDLLGLPNMPNYALGPLAGSECDTLTDNITSIVKEDLFSIYPNPAFDDITVMYSGLANAEGVDHTICLYDVNGQLVRTVNAKEEKTILKIGDLTNGMYLLKLTSGDQIFSQTFIVSK